MKNHFLLFISLVFVNFSFAQNQKFSATLSYPLTIGDNFLEAYSGYVDVGAQYRFLDFTIAQVGVSVNYSLLGVDNPELPNEKLNASLLQPRLFAEFPLGSDGAFRPNIGIGYGFNSFDENDDSMGIGIMQINTTTSGLVVNLGASYTVYNAIFVLAQFDWADINRFTSNQNESFDNRGMLIKLGAGIRF